LTKLTCNRHLSESFDYQRCLYYLAYQIQATRAYITEGICLILFLQDHEFLITALASFIVKGNLYPLLHESDAALCVLDFEHNTNLTLRQMLNGKDQAFIELAQKVVQINDFEGKEVDNLLLLDKIRDHEGVLRYLVKI